MINSKFELLLGSTIIAFSIFAFYKFRNILKKSIEKTEECAESQSSNIKLNDSIEFDTTVKADGLLNTAFLQNESDIYKKVENNVCDSLNDTHIEDVMQMNSNNDLMELKTCGFPDENLNNCLLDTTCFNQSVSVNTICPDIKEGTRVINFENKSNLNIENEYCIDQSTNNIYSHRNEIIFSNIEDAHDINVNTEDPIHEIYTNEDTRQNYVEDIPNDQLKIKPSNVSMNEICSDKTECLWLNNLENESIQKVENKIIEQYVQSSDNMNAIEEKNKIINQSDFEEIRYGKLENVSFNKESIVENSLIHENCSDTNENSQEKTEFECLKKIVKYQNEIFNMRSENIADLTDMFSVLNVAEHIQSDILEESDKINSVININLEIVENNLLSKYEPESYEKAEVISEIENNTLQKLDEKKDFIVSKILQGSNEVFVTEHHVSKMISDYLDINNIEKYDGNHQEVNSSDVLDSNLIEDSDLKIENWDSDNQKEISDKAWHEDSFSKFKRNSLEETDVTPSPHPSNDSEHSYCMNNLTEKVATLTAESIFDRQNAVIQEQKLNLEHENGCDVDHIFYNGKVLDVIYFTESNYKSFEIDAEILRSIPVGSGGRIIGKKGRTRNELQNKYGASLWIYNDPNDSTKQLLQITCKPENKTEIEQWVDKMLSQILNNNVNTIVSNPALLKPKIPLGKMITVQIVDMTSISDIKLIINDDDYNKEYNKMQREMNEDYARQDPNALLPHPISINCICVAMLSPVLFARAIVLSIYDQTVIIYLLDIGKILTTYLNCLFKIREKYLIVTYRVIPAKIGHLEQNDSSYPVEKIFNKFFRDPVRKCPRKLYAMITRMETCCIPSVCIYMPLSAIKSGEYVSNCDYIDFAELMVRSGIGKLEPKTIYVEDQVKYNKPQLDTVNNNNDVVTYFMPSNSNFYDNYLDIGCKGFCH